jgi:hypothetical protein
MLTKSLASFQLRSSEQKRENAVFKKKKGQPPLDFATRCGSFPLTREKEGRKKERRKNKK